MFYCHCSPQRFVIRGFQSWKACSKVFVVCVSRLRLLLKHVETDSEDHTFYCLFCLFIGAKP